MPAFLVRKIQAGRDGLGGTRGRVQAMVYASSSAAAKEIGAEDLGVDVSQVTVEAYEDDTSFMAVQTRPGHKFDPNDVEEVKPTIRQGE